MESQLFENEPYLGKIVNDIENGIDTFERLGAERGIYMFRDNNNNNNQ